MRRLVITENEVGKLSQFVVETSAGVRTTGVTLASALQKLDIAPRGNDMQPWDFTALEEVFKRIRPSGGTSQIHQGVQS